MPSLSAWPAHCAESCSITSLSSARTTFDASSPNTCVSTMRDARTKLSRTSSRFHVPRRRRAASTQSLCSPDSIMTTSASLDERHARRLPADEICSQHGSASRHPAHWFESYTQRRRSRHPNSGRFDRRRSMASCCQSARFSSVRLVRVLSTAGSAPNRASTRTLLSIASHAARQSSSLGIEFWQTTTGGRRSCRRRGWRK